MCSVFFFKQKTAYEMRISDWSSDVCSSDLLGRQARVERAGFDRLCFGVAGSDGGRQRFGPEIGVLPILELCLALVEVGGDFGDAVAILVDPCLGRRGGGFLLRSEEHTSELQSLMRISYAVFCLKKKKQITK